MQISHDPEFEAFLEHPKRGLDMRQLSLRMLQQVLSDINIVPHPTCCGSWLEFGLHLAGTYLSLLDSVGPAMLMSLEELSKPFDLTLHCVVVRHSTRLMKDWQATL